MRTDKEKQKLRGAVKNLRVETAQIEQQNGQITEKPWISQDFTFNQDGWLIEQVFRNPDGSEWRTVNDYSDSGKLLAKRSYDASGGFSSEIGYVYDDNERLVAEQFVDQDGKITAPTTYIYDDKGGKTKIQELDFAGETNVMIGIEGTDASVMAGDVRQVMTRYDERGEAVEVKVFNTAGLLFSRVEIIRDARGNPLEEIHYVGDVFPFAPCGTDSSCPTADITALTDEQKAELEAEMAEMARMFSSGAVMSKNIHKYDTEGRLLESKLTMMNMEASRQTFTYDEAGNKSEEVSYYDGGTFENRAIFKREYDEQGNWTKEIVSTASSADAGSDSSMPAHITRRTITYYK